MKHKHQTVQKTPLTGDLTQYMLPHVFLKAVLHQFSGILEVQNDEVTKTLYFKNGNVVHVESNVRQETFGQFLIEKKVLDQQMLDAALLELANQKDLKLGEILIRRGLLDPNALMDQLNQHQEIKLSAAFAIKKGNYRFDPTLNWPGHVTVFPLRSLNIFFSSVEKHVSLQEINYYSGIHPLAVVQLNHNPSRDMALPPFATRVLNTLSRELVSVDILARNMSIPVDKLIIYLFIFDLAAWITVQEDSKKDVTFVAEKPVEKPVEHRPENSAAEAMVEKKEVNPILLKRMEIDHKALDGMNFYQMFSVGPEFTAQMLQVHFFQLMAEYKKYEDLIAGKEMLTWIRTAYDVLRDPKLKVMYDRRFAFRKKDPKIENAERTFFQAVRMIERGDLEPAKPLIEQINKAVGDSTYRAYQAWLLLKMDPIHNLNDASTLIQEAFTMYPADPFAHFIAADIQKAKKNYKKAETHYRSAIQVFPGFTEATQALEKVRFEVTKEKRLADKEKEKADAAKKPGFFDLSVGGFNLGTGKKNED
jgi:tetratricopeptide (TPR) repeat protein